MGFNGYRGAGDARVQIVTSPNRPEARRSLIRRSLIVSVRLQEVLFRSRYDCEANYGRYGGNLKRRKGCELEKTLDGETGCKSPKTRPRSLLSKKWLQP
jgi:hypothetical protein